MSSIRAFDSLRNRGVKQGLLLAFLECLGLASNSLAQSLPLPIRRDGTGLPDPPRLSCSCECGNASVSIFTYVKWITY